MKIEQVRLEETNKTKRELLHQKNAAAISALLLLTGVFALFFCFVSYNLTVVIMGISLLFPLCMYYLQGTKAKDIPGYILLLFMVLAVVVNPTGFANGFISFINQLILCWNHHFGTYVALYKDVTISRINEIQFWFVFFGLFYFIWNWCVKTNRTILFFILEFILVFTGIYFELAINPWILAVFGISCILSFMGKSFQTQGVRSIVTVIATLIITTFLITYFISGYTGNHLVAQIKQGVISAVDYARYGEDTLPKGDMRKADTMVGEEDSKALVVTGKNYTQMHFKGFVGASFNGICWQETALSAYSNENAGMIDWMEAHGLSIPFQLGRFARGSGNSSQTDHFIVKNTGAYKKYIYLPYNAVDMDTSKTKVYYDQQTRSTGFFGDTNYQFAVSRMQDTADASIQTLINEGNPSKEYKQVENVYSTFVYETYLSVDDAEKTAILDSFYHGDDWSEADYYQITTQIRLALQQLNTYQEKPSEKYRGSVDFISWFLEGNHECNSAAYATAAVLAYRTVGIPARYVEGYYLSESDAANAENSVTLTQADAHAWVEVYITGIGWVAVEVVPGSYYADYQIQDIAPSPESMVNIVADNEDTLKGTTADVLQAEQKKSDERQELQQTIIHIMGIIVVVLLCIFAVILLIRIQAISRKLYFEHYLLGSHTQEKKCRKIYQRVWKIFALLKCGGDERFPYAFTDKFAMCFETVDGEEYERFIGLIQKSRFSQYELSEAEFRTVSQFASRVTDEAYARAKLFISIKMKYLYGIF